MPKESEQTMKVFLLGLLVVSSLAGVRAHAMECTYKLTIGSAAMIDHEYKVDDQAQYVSPDSELIQKLHTKLKTLGYLTEVQDASEASVWIDLTASLKRLGDSKNAQSAYQLTVKNNLTQMFTRVAESIERGNYSKAEKQLTKKVVKTPNYIADELNSCPSAL